MIVSIKEELRRLSTTMLPISICSRNFGAFQPHFKALTQEQITQQFVETEVINHAEKCSTGFFLAQPCQSTQEF